jgi:hypothetical protein
MNGNRPILIYTSAVTNRLKYVCDFVFKRNLQVDYSFSVNNSECIDNAFILEYSAQKSRKFSWLFSEGLLQEEGHLRVEDPNFSGEARDSVLFPSAEADSLLPFDILSAVFYCLSLYQAYTLKDVDEHGRLNYQQWFLRRKGLDQYPIVEIWLDILRKELKKEGIVCADTPKYKRTVSFDIDHTFAYLDRTVRSNLRALAGDVLKGRWAMLCERIAVWRSTKEDPFVLSERLFPLNGGVEYKFFVLMKEGEMDSLNLNTERKEKELRRLRKFGSIGLHPSYQAGMNAELIAKERKLLESALDESITQSRHHFLRQSIPISQEALLKCGIQEDYSIGYYDRPGLMACCSLSFPFYNILSEEHTDLEIFPFFWMDSMNRYYRAISEDDELIEVHRWEDVFRFHGGRACYVFHNDSMVLDRYRFLVTSLSEC